MDQSAKYTSDNKCILIRNPAYKYKHYKFLKSEGLVGAVPVQRLPPKTTRSFSLQTCSSFIISSQLILSTTILSEHDDLFLIPVVNPPEFPCHFLQFSACETSGLILASHSPPAVHTDGSKNKTKKGSPEFRPRYKLIHLTFVIYLITC